MKDLLQHIVQEFGSPMVQELYMKKADEGLWGSEEILIKKYFHPKSRVLDIGCGTGRTTIPLYQMGYDVVGIDITPAMIENAKKIAVKKRWRIPYEIGDATKLRFQDHSFDNAIFSNNGWTQIPEKENRQKALKEIYRILERGRCYIFTTHVRQMQGYSLFWIKQWIKLFIFKPFGFKIDELEFGDRFFERDNSGTQFLQKQYIHIPSVKEVKEQIKTAGFELVYMERGDNVSKHKPTKYPPMFYVCKK